jgi:hypothetical protein
MRKLRSPNKLDWLIYSLFRMWWNPIFRDNKQLSLALAREINSYWAKKNKFIGTIKNHKHDLIIDTEVVFTNDGEPQPRSSIFLECLSYENDCGCSFILRDNEIIDYINSLVYKAE